MTLLLLLLSCTSGPPRPEPTASPGTAVSLAHAVPTQLSLPASSRSEPPAQLPMGPWQLATSTAEYQEWVAPVPLRTRAMFTARPQKGMSVHTADGKAISHAKRVKGKGNRFWRWNKERVTVRLPAGVEPDGVHMVYERATERARQLNRTWWCEDQGITQCDATESMLDFARAEVLIGDDSHNGLLLPAPATATWTLTVPPAGELLLVPTLVQPEVRDGTSDGATLVVTVDGSEVRRIAVTHETGRVPVDLSRWAGQSVALGLATEPGATSDYDYVFLEEPAVASRQQDGRRVVLVFVDTLRPDHLGLYGYHRDTSPWLDEWAQKAAVFESARSVAPWTLPTTRTMITGRQPEFFDTTRTLPDRFAEQGWATAMIAGNVFVGANFGIARGWGTHHNATFPRADQQVDKALDFFERHEGRDSLLLLHFMDAHLPYNEPTSHRSLFAGKALAPMGEKFSRGAVPRRPTEPQKQYIIDRYDNNIRWITDQLGRLAQSLDDDDVVLFVADHGEEFWEHDGYEHGHTLYDELLRVPMVLHAPGIDGSRIPEPVSMLDVTPTLLDLAGIPADGLDGESLVPLARADAAAKARFAGRDQAFGRPLYGFSRWGVLDAQTGHKYMTHQGREELYDLGLDGGELNDLLSGQSGAEAEPWRTQLTDALGRDTAMGYRIELNRGSALSNDLVLEVRVPGGVRSTWEGWDPMRNSVAHVEADGEVFRAVFEKGTTGSREIFFAPVEPLADVTHRLEFHLQLAKSQTRLCIPKDKAPEPGARRNALLTTTFHKRRVKIGWGVFPERAGGDAGGMDAEDREELEMLGYIEEDAGTGGAGPEVELEPCAEGSSEPPE